MPLTLSPHVTTDAVAADAAITTKPANTDAIAAGQAQPPAVETKLDRLLKMIPTEVIAAYPAVLALSAEIAWPYYELTIAVLGLVAVVAVLHRDGAVNHLQPTWHQYVVRCLAFAAWTMVVGNPLAPLSISLEQAHLFGAVGAVFIPLLGYLTLSTSAAA